MEYICEAISENNVYDSNRNYHHYVHGIILGLFTFLVTRLSTQVFVCVFLNVRYLLINLP
uniref:Uncharacterized protein n=1 Tax=Octopus bimaculoides TaxID=37653 RepID=A0A0L8IEG4_OCTBM